MVASREIYVPKRVASPHILQRSRRSSSLITDHMASALHTRPLLFMVDFLPYTLWNCVASSSSLSAHPHFKYSAQNFYGTSYLAPPMICHFSHFPCIFYLLLALIFSQGKGSLWHTDIGVDMHVPWLCHKLLYTFRVVYSFCPGQQSTSLQEGHSYQLAIVMQSILNTISSTSLTPQPWAVGNFSYILEAPTLHPISITIAPWDNSSFASSTLSASQVKCNHHRLPSVSWIWIIFKLHLGAAQCIAAAS